jgi:hypothetical protein
VTDWDRFEGRNHWGSIVQGSRHREKLCISCRLFRSFALSEGAAFRTLSSRDLPKKRPAYKLVLVADLQDFAHDRFWGFFLSLTPDDSPLLVRNLGTQDIYALDWEEAEAGH